MNFLEKIFKHRKLLSDNHYRLGQSSIADWLLIVWVFAALLAIFVALAGYQFFNYWQSDTIAERSVTATSTAILFNHAKLDEAVKYFTEREQKFNKIKTTKLRFADPSK